MIDLAKLEQTPLVSEPFEHLVVPQFVRQEAASEIGRDFPTIDEGGSFPLSELHYGPSFGALVDELHGPGLKEVVARKFDIDLSHRPSMLTVRGQARSKDGRIHTDSRTKILTVLLYMSGRWSDAGGRLRLLRSENMDDYFAEVAPDRATAVFFRCTKNAWHGHTPYVGERRAIQLNWVTDESVVRREQSRHRVSSKLKGLKKLISVRSSRPPKVDAR